MDPLDAVEGTYEDAFRLLAADGYDGLATIEHWKGQEGTLRGIAQLKQLLDRIEKSPV